jgi:hypothetical protein
MIMMKKKKSTVRDIMKKRKVQEESQLLFVLLSLSLTWAQKHEIIYYTSTTREKE